MLVAVLAVQTVAADDVLQSAASDGHLWMVRGVEGEGGNDRPPLLHHAIEMDGPYFSRGPSLPQKPEAMAAWGDRVWLVFSPRQRGEQLVREVYTLRMQRDPAMGMYHPVPRDRMVLSEPLPGNGRLVGFVGSEAGPYALIAPFPHEKIKVRRDGGDAADSNDASRAPQLQQLRNERWVQHELPESMMEITGEDHVHFAIDGVNVDRLNVLIADSDARDQSLLLRRDGDGQWSETSLAIDVRTVRSLLRVVDRLAVVRMRDVSSAFVQYVRQNSVIDLAEIAVPAGSWAVQGMRGAMYVVSENAAGELLMQEISPIHGRVGEVMAMRDQPLPTAKLWHTGLMLAVSVIAVLIVLLVRPGNKNSVQLPEHMGYLPAVPRLVALLIDLVPGAVLAMLVMRAGPAELLRLPLMSETLDQAGPHLLMLGLTVAHCTIMELARGTTLGKLLVGASVMSMNGQPPSAGQILARNGVKLMVLIVPPLAIFILLNPHMQGFNDMAAQTVVLREADEATPDEQES